MKLVIHPVDLSYNPYILIPITQKALIIACVNYCKQIQPLVRKYILKNDEKELPNLIYVFMLVLIYEVYTRILFIADTKSTTRYLIVSTRLTTCIHYFRIAQGGPVYYKLLRYTIRNFSICH
ncbi:hypothetical protein BDF20DRAFT_896233 [Mycotypha africana]|uniref:uncharacterized protein n=1 Tax=Mycotypha africana TaxID=64632 RepID=UPI00230139FF|nr:uncharacterized protein BDF20DRAFT_896233 [Mycotypha africana]KAI8968418.1 hypothetical protein BDF20DRAFT_896233 [Mycotypha africana]